jgi:hypothetical protein
MSSSSTLSILCSPDDGQVEERLVRQQSGMHRFWVARKRT